MSSPTARLENQYRQQGYQFVAGLDEVGMGCLAGPVVAAAVVFTQKIPKGLNDSKLLSSKIRESLCLEIQSLSVVHAIGMASVEEIDSINIYQAGRLAMKRATENLLQRPDFLLVDGRMKIDLDLPQLSIIKGDRKSVSIAAASILAKVYRDRLMVELDAKYPGYGLAQHKGYGSPSHRHALMSRGPTEIHRKSFQWKPPKELAPPLHPST